MATTETDISKNGTYRKSRWKRPKAKKKYTEAEMRLIETTRAVLEIIEKRKQAGEFDEFLEEEYAKR